MKNLQKTYLLVLLLTTINLSAIAQSTTHMVKRGETLASIAQMYGITEAALRAANPDVADLFFAGMKLQIPAGSTPVTTPRSSSSEVGYSSSTYSHPTNYYSSTSSSTSTDSYCRFEISFASMAMEIDSDGEDDPDPTVGVSVGILAGKSLSQSVPIFVEYGINATWTTRDLSENSNEEVRFTYLSAAVPLNLAYKIALDSNSDVAITPFVGVNFKGNFVGKRVRKYEYGGKEKEQEFDFFDKKDTGGKNYTANRFQMGMNVGVGLTIQKIYIGYRFQPDFMEYRKKTKSRTNYVSLGVYF